MVQTAGITSRERLDRYISEAAKTVGHRVQYAELLNLPSRLIRSLVVMIAKNCLGVKLSKMPVKWSNSKSNRQVMVEMVKTPVIWSVK